jgi:hypothetical protein
MSQRHLIDQILEQLWLDKDDVVTKDVPMKSSVLLGRHVESKDFDTSFHYHSVIGKLNYLEKGSRSDISYVSHQCARHSETPKVEHGEAI